MSCTAELLWFNGCPNHPLARRMLQDCRLYQTSDGLGWLPDPAWIDEALRR